MIDRFWARRLVLLYVLRQA